MEDTIEKANWLRYIVENQNFDSHFQNCSVCRFNYYEALEILSLTRRNYELAAIIWKARKMRFRATRMVELLRRDINGPFRSARNSLNKDG